MPITKELENLRKFESVGFTHEQSEVLTDVIEQSHGNRQQTLKDIFSKLETRIDKFETKADTIEKKIDNILRVTDSIDLHIKAGQTESLLKIFAVVACCASVAVAVSKLL